MRTCKSAFDMAKELAFEQLLRDRGAVDLDERTIGALAPAVRRAFDLDAPVERYIGPDLLTVFDVSPADITVRRLLHHTAGLPVHFNYYYSDEPGRPPSLPETIRRYGIIVQPPKGATFRIAALIEGVDKEKREC